MAARECLQGEMLQCLERRWRLRVSMILGYTKLSQLEEDWVMSFMNEQYFVLPLFGCKCCGFSYLLQMRLEGDLSYGPAEIPSLEPLNQHQELCKAFKLPIVKNANMDSRSFTQEQSVGFYSRTRMESVIRCKRSHEFDMVIDTAPLITKVQKTEGEGVDVPNIATSLSESDTDFSFGTLFDSEFFATFGTMYTVEIPYEGCEDSLAEDQEAMLLAIQEDEFAVTQEMCGDITKLCGEDLPPVFVPQSEVLEEEESGVITIMGDTCVTMSVTDATDPVDSQNDCHETAQEHVTMNMVVRPKTVITRRLSKNDEYANLLACLPEAADKMNAMLHAIGDEIDTAESVSNMDEWEDHSTASSGAVSHQMDETPVENIESGAAKVKPMLEEKSAATLMKLFRTVGLVTALKSSANGGTSAVPLEYPANEHELSEPGSSDMEIMERASEVLLKMVQYQRKVPEHNANLDGIDEMDMARKIED